MIFKPFLKKVFYLILFILLRSEHLLLGSPLLSLRLHRQVPAQKCRGLCVPGLSQLCDEGGRDGRVLREGGQDEDPLHQAHLSGGGARGERSLRGKEGEGPGVCEGEDGRVYAEGEG